MPTNILYAHVWWLRNHRKLCIAMKSYICGIDLQVKKGIVPKVFSVSWFICCALAIRYITYSTVGQSIASISDLGSIFTSALCSSVNMAPRSDISAIHLFPVLNIIHTVHANMHSTYKHVAHPDTFRHTNMHASVHRDMHCTNAYACTYTHALIHD